MFQSPYGEMVCKPIVYGHGIVDKVSVPLRGDGLQTKHHALEGGTR